MMTCENCTPYVNGWSNLAANVVSHDVGGVVVTAKIMFISDVSVMGCVPIKEWLRTLIKPCATEFIEKVVLHRGQMG